MNKHNEQSRSQRLVACITYFAVMSLFCATAMATFTCPPAPKCYHYTSGPPNCNLEWSCVSGQKCCDGWCLSGCTGECCGHTCCSSTYCQTCVGGQCKVCGGDLDKTCCNGTCCDSATEGCCDAKTIYNISTEKCCDEGTGHKCPNEQTCCWGDCCPSGQGCCTNDHLCHDFCQNGPPTGHCDISHNNDEGNICPGCAGLILGPHCMDITFRDYSGQQNHGCSGGCPGECIQGDDVYCYTEYKCRENPMRPASTCATQEGSPGGVGCMDTDPMTACVSCRKDTTFPGEDHYVSYSSCFGE
jgi:hypothetical protein